MCTKVTIKTIRAALLLQTKFVPDWGDFFSGQQRVHIGERAAAGDDQPGGEADGRGDQRDDPGGGQRRRRASQLWRLEHKWLTNKNTYFKMVS